jgi:outer membrane protein TolC
VLQSEVDLVSSQNDLFNTERDLSRTKNAFRLFAGIPTDDDVELVATLSYQPVQIDQTKAIQSALENRSEVLNADRNKQLRKMDIDLATSKSDFRLDLTATYGFNRNDSELNNVFRDFGRTRSATLTVSAPLFDWGSNSLEVEAAQVLHTNAQATYDFVRQQIRQEINDLISRIQAAESRIKVLEKVVAVAQKSYDISLSRFQSGTISRNDLAQAQQRLTTAKINNLSALIDYRIGLADLKRRTLYDFEKNEPVRPTFVD